MAHPAPLCEVILSLKPRYAILCISFMYSGKERASEQWATKLVQAFFFLNKKQIGWVLK